MATAVYGGADRAAPDQFRGCAGIRRLTGQSPLPKTTVGNAKRNLNAQRRNWLTQAQAAVILLNRSSKSQV
jgi:hypothetical protein